MSHLAPVPNLIAPAITTPTPTAQRAKLNKSAQEFAGVLIDTLWSEFQNDPLASDPGSFSDPGAQSLKGLGLQAMSGALAARGSFGFAAMIEHQLEPTPAATAADSADLSKLKSQSAIADKLEVAGTKPAASMEMPR
ncbi:MAG: hypothetical protein ACRD1C_02465 [Terriglobales bacterium]